MSFKKQEEESQTNDFQELLCIVAKMKEARIKRNLSEQEINTLRERLKQLLESNS